jgi:anti-sigma B factor antagonist
MSGLELLQIETNVSPDGSEATMRVAGELDMTTADQLTSEFGKLLQNGCGCLQIDLSEVSFLDSSGIKALLLCWQESSEVGKEFRVVGARPMARRVMSVSGVGAVLGCEESTVG